MIILSMSPLAGLCEEEQHEVSATNAEIACSSIHETQAGVMLSRRRSVHQPKFNIGSDARLPLTVESV